MPLFKRSLFYLLCTVCFSQVANAQVFTIRDAIKQTVNTNPGVAEAAANRRATESEMRQVQSTLLPQVRLEEYRRFSELFERDVYDILSLEASLERRSGVPGSAAPSLVRSRAEALIAELSQTP